MEVNRAIKIEDLQVGDEVIVRGVDLNYMEIVRLPKQKQYKDYHGNPYMGYTSAMCNRINSVFDKKWDTIDLDNVRFDFEHKSIWLVKRQGINK